MHRNISAHAVARVPFRRAAPFVRRPPSGVYGDRVEGSAPSSRHFRSMLTAGAPTGVSVSHDVDVEILAVHSDVDRVDVDLAWAPTGNRATLPSFTGTLHVASGDAATTELVLEGSYRVPLGPIGRFGDGVVGNRIAQRSMTELLERMSKRIEKLSLEASTAAQVTPTPRPPDMRREPRPERTGR